MEHWENDGTRVLTAERDIVAICDTEQDARLISAAPELLALVEELLADVQDDRDDIFLSATIDGDPSTLDPIDRAGIAELDAKIQRARDLIADAKPEPPPALLRRQAM